MNAKYDERSKHIEMQHRYVGGHDDESCTLFMF